MRVCRTVSEFRAFRTAVQGTVGFVPTMGYLHEGHLSLVRAAREKNDLTAASIFVNPAQFNSAADLAAYPRSETRDLRLFEEAGVDVVLVPSAEEMYPPHFQTYVNVETITQQLEGEYRPGHFKGVTTVVAKLLNVVQPTRAYFGQKDAQQVAVIQQMVRDLNFPVEIVVCPTVRESDGLAMSSRNVRLSAEERRAAVVLHKSLKAAQAAYARGERQPDVLRGAALAVLQQEPLARVEYVSLNDAQTLQEATTLTDVPLLLSMAVYIGQVRLIDNILLSTSSG
ncbi:MAG: pantoate--beta-alanine ligase [Anaerolineae bacterium]|nr:pantoate--beta-alanine ligase [Anaerolineae bacterium]